MAAVDILRNKLIDKILTISDKDYLSALHKLLQTDTADNRKITLTEEQTIMLRMSDKDIAAGRLVTQNELDKKDLEWLKGL